MLMKHLIEKYHADQLSYSQIEQLMIDHPELEEINRHIIQKGI
jgi:hypothetical protein